MASPRMAWLHGARSLRRMPAAGGRREGCLRPGLAAVRRESGGDRPGQDINNRRANIAPKSRANLDWASARPPGCDQRGRMSPRWSKSDGGSRVESGSGRTTLVTSAPMVAKGTQHGEDTVRPWRATWAQFPGRRSAPGGFFAGARAAPTSRIFWCSGNGGPRRYDQFARLQGIVDEGTTELGRSSGILQPIAQFAGRRRCSPPTAATR
jgi:hypothetical protein